MPKSVSWNRDEHTECKHRVLASYISVWFSILATKARRLLFVDGFAGPGEYEGGEPGSPIVALDAVKRHKDEGRLKDVEIDFVFVEKETRRADNLRAVLTAHSIHPDVRCHVMNGEFHDHAAQIIRRFQKHEEQSIPSFYMIDPCGVKGNRMDILGQIVENRGSELFISFMYEPIRRFKGEREFEEPLTALYGTDEWKRALYLGETPESKQFLHSLYANQLKRYGVKFVVPFEIWKGNRHMYTIYFCTGHRKGCNLMKESVWRVDPWGKFELHAHADQQLLLFDTDTEPLVRQLRNRFGIEWVSIEAVEEFVKGDETPFHLGHLREKTLRKMLRTGRLLRDPSTGSGFPVGKNVRVKFLDDAEGHSKACLVGGGRSLFDRTNP